MSANSAPLNLARRPLRNERLPTLVLAVACAVLGALTIRHGVAAWELRSGGARDVVGQLGAVERQIDELDSQAARLGGTAPTRDQLREWQSLKELVDLRAFSWTGLFAALEAVVPPTVRLVSVAPTRGGAGEGTGVTLSAVGRDVEDGITLLRALQADRRFGGARLLTISDHEQGVAIGCTVRYVGTPARPATRGGAAAIAEAPATAATGSLARAAGAR